MWRYTIVFTCNTNDGIVLEVLPTPLESIVIAEAFALGYSVGARHPEGSSFYVLDLPTCHTADMALKLATAICRRDYGTPTHELTGDAAQKSLREYMGEQGIAATPAEFDDEDRQPPRRPVTSTSPRHSGECDMCGKFHSSLDHDNLCPSCRTVWNG